MFGFLSNIGSWLGDAYSGSLLESGVNSLLGGSGGPLQGPTISGGYLDQSPVGSSYGGGSFLGDLLSPKNVGTALIGAGQVASGAYASDQAQKMSQQQFEQTQALADQHFQQSLELEKLKASLAAGSAGTAAKIAAGAQLAIADKNIAANKALTRYQQMLKAKEDAMQANTADTGNIIRAYGSMTDALQRPLLK